MNYKRLFDSMHPGFFAEPEIKNMPGDRIFAELIMDLRKTGPKPAPCSCPDEIKFGVYNGGIEKIREAAAQVETDWVRFFCEGCRFFCAFDRDTIAAFCILEDWGMQDGLHIGGPGCVGTVPGYRKKGIGLEMVRLATDVLIKDGFNISWIHYTAVWPWYEKLGYQTVLKWNRSGIFSA